MRNRNSTRIAWCITGSGDRIEECVNFMKELKHRYEPEIDVYLSREGLTVLKFYRLFDTVKEEFTKVSTEKGPNAPFLAGRIQLGRYDFVLIAPATANTVAKIAHGIADTLVTNTAAQAIKAYVPVYIYPVDQKVGEIITRLPDGRDLKLRIRKEDVENVDKLRRMDGITVLSAIQEVETLISTNPS